MSWIPIAISVGSALLGGHKKQSGGDTQLTPYQPYQPPLVAEPDIEEYLRRMRALREKLTRYTSNEPPSPEL